MDTFQFYFIKGKDGSPRHVVVATGDESDGVVPVERVGLHPSVAGLARRGAPPKFLKPVSVEDLTPMDLDDVPEDLQRAAERLLAAPAGSDTTN